MTSPTVDHRCDFNAAGHGAGCAARAKLVRADFIQALDAHWRHRAPARNRLAEPSS